MVRGSHGGQRKMGAALEGNGASLFRIVAIDRALDLSRTTLRWLAIVDVLICVNGFIWVGGFNA
jgi:hypothetical protein